MTDQTSNKKTMTLNLSQEEMYALIDLGDITGMSKTGVMRQALKLFQLANYRARNGDEMLFKNQETGETIKPLIFGIPECHNRIYQLKKCLDEITDAIFDYREEYTLDDPESQKTIKLVSKFDEACKLLGELK